MNTLISLADWKANKEAFPYRFDGRSQTKKNESLYKKLRSLKFQVIAHDGAYAQCKSSDGQYWQWIHCDQLQHEDGTYLKKATVIEFSRSAIARTLAISTGYDGKAIESLDQLDMFE